MNKLDFSFVIKQLKLLKESNVKKTKSRENTKDLQKHIAEIQKAISCLEMCASLGITSKASITKIPISERSFGYYRILEYDEMDNQLNEFSNDDKPFELLGLELIVKLEDKYK